MLEFLQQIDNNLIISINQLHSPFWDYFMSAFSGKWIWTPMYATIVYLLFKNLDYRKAILVAIAIIIAVACADIICARAIRPFAERLRPANLQNPISGFIHVVNDYRGGTYGFPSCHAANSFALAILTSLLFRKRLFTASILLWAVINSYSRMYLGVHYPGDLIVGALIGSALAMVVYFATTHWTSIRTTSFRQTAITPIAGIAITIGLLIYSTASVLR